MQRKKLGFVFVVLAALLLAACSREPKDQLTGSVVPPSPTPEPTPVATPVPTEAPTPAPTPDPFAALLAALPREVTPPDSLPTAEEQLDYTVASSSSLKLRAGPGTSFSQLDSVPRGTAVQRLGDSATVSNWVLTQYGDTYGWLCTDYLS